MTASSDQATGSRRLYWEAPIGTVRGFLEEPGPKFVDLYNEKERLAIIAVEQTRLLKTELHHHLQQIKGVHQ